jgi:alpha-L-fucosidase
VTATDHSAWFAEARYGLMLHYGLYSILGRGEWVQNREQIPAAEYASLARQFNPKKFDADAICELAVRAGMRYVCFTTMHHDGFRLYDTELSDLNSVHACGRDLVEEMVTAARRHGLRITLYHSLNNWHDQPDAVAALESRDAYETFVAATHERLRELVTRFNPIDCLWYDGWWPFHAEGWQAERMNDMVRSIQPHILFNGRNGLPGDFGTPEQHVTAPTPWRPWEACITTNRSWCWHRGDRDWKTPWQVLEMVNTVSRQRGNLLLNIGPRGDGSIPAQVKRLLTTVGEWIGQNSDAVYGTDMFTLDYHERGEHRSEWVYHGPFTAKGNSLYLWVRRWPGPELAVGGFQCNVRSVTLPAFGLSPTFRQEGERVVVSGLPATPPDRLCTLVRFECDRPPALYMCAGLTTPRVAHPHYDPCPSDLPPP